MALAKHSLCQRVAQSVVMIMRVEARAQWGKHNRKMGVLFYQIFALISEILGTLFFSATFPLHLLPRPGFEPSPAKLHQPGTHWGRLYLSSYWATAPQLKMVVLNVGFCHFSQHKFLPWESKCNRLYSVPVLPLTSWCSPLKTEGPGYGLNSLVPVLGDIKGVVGVIKKDSSFWVTFTN